MDWLEQELTAALARTDPPAGFAERAARRAVRPVFPRWMAAAAAVIVLAGAGAGYRQYRGEMAKRQVLQAFQIASEKVDRVRTQVAGAAR